MPKTILEKQMAAADAAAFPIMSGPTLNGRPFPLWSYFPSMCAHCQKTNAKAGGVFCKKCEEYARMFCGGK